MDIYVIVINRARFYSEVTSTEARGGRGSCCLTIEPRGRFIIYLKPADAQIHIRMLSCK